MIWRTDAPAPCMAQATAALADVRGLLGDAAGRARRVAEATDWQSDAARAFHDAASHHAEQVAQLSARADDLVAEAASWRSALTLWGCTP